MAAGVVFRAAPLTSPLGRVIVAPLQFHTTGEEWLQLTAINSVAGVTLRMTTSILQEQPPAQIGTVDLTPASNRTVSTAAFYPGAGAILSVAARVTVGAPLVGQTFVAVDLFRGRPPTGERITRLFSGYITATQSMAFPGSPIVPSTSGEPVIRYITGATQGFGQPIQEVVPTNARWELLSFHFTVESTMTGTGGTPVLEFASGGTVFGHIPNSFAYPAGAFGPVNATWMAGLALPAAQIQSDVVNSLPVNYRLIAGAAMAVAGISQFRYGPAHYVVREWQEGA